MRTTAVVCVQHTLLLCEVGCMEAMTIADWSVRVDSCLVGRAIIAHVVNRQ